MCTQILWNNVHKHLLWETKAVRNENTTVCCDLNYLMSHMQSCLWFCINCSSYSAGFIIWDCWIPRQEYWPETPGSDVFNLGSYIPCTVVLSLSITVWQSHSTCAFLHCQQCLWLPLSEDPKQHLQHTSLYSAFRQAQKSLKGPSYDPAGWAHRQSSSDLLFLYIQRKSHLSDSKS